MRPTMTCWRLVLLLGLAGALGHPARGFATGELVSLTLEPATIRQTSDKATSKVVAIVLLQEPSPTVFVCTVRSNESAKISFPAIIFRKGDRKATCEGKVEWKNVRSECRVRLSAYNADAPDQRMTFTVMLIPVEEPIQSDEPPTNPPN